jgi:hypothetical protein
MFFLQKVSNETLRDTEQYRRTQIIYEIFQDNICKFEILRHPEKHKSFSAICEELLTCNETDN